MAVSLLPELTKLVGTPRALTVRFPYGAPFGNPFNPWLQTRVLREALGLLEQTREPNTIEASRYRWRQSRERVAW